MSPVLGKGSSSTVGSFSVCLCQSPLLFRQVQPVPIALLWQWFSSSWVNKVSSQSHQHLCLLPVLGCQAGLKGAGRAQLGAGEAPVTAPQCQDRNYCKEKQNQSNITCESAEKPHYLSSNVFCQGLVPMWSGGWVP